MSNKLYNALDIYFDIVKNGKKEDSLSPKELEAYMLVTRDAKLMSILNSFDKDVEPSLMDIVPKYNALIAEEKAMEPKTDTQEPEVVSSLNSMVDDPKNALLNANQRSKRLEKSMKLTQVGYANVVLMSIIVMIIVAIICVFIFL